MITPEQFKTLHRLIQERVDTAVALSWAEFDDHAALDMANEGAKERLSSFLQTLMQPDAQLAAAQREAAEAQAAVKANHEWHQNYDDYGGYPDSELCNINLGIIGSLKPAALAAAIEQARREEREACAKICEHLPWIDGERLPAGIECARAIRARSEK